jgi:phospholipid-binding lipoprotein MlaA
MSRFSASSPSRRVGRATLAGVVALACVGCATRPDGNPRDPFETYNRGMFEFNDGVDRAIFKPAATMYRAVTPAPVRTGVSNFLGNIEDVWSFVNSVLQGKPQAAATTFVRFNVNTFLGLGGVLDIASEARIDRQREDFGQTLGYWGVPSGPYLVLPFLGSSTVRDTVALPVDMAADIVGNIDHVPTRNAMKVVDLLDTRAGLLRASDALDEVALDKYSFTRDAFLQRRRNAVFDGDPPDEPAEPRR